MFISSTIVFICKSLSILHSCLFADTALEKTSEKSIIVVVKISIFFIEKGVMR